MKLDPRIRMYLMSPSFDAWDKVHTVKVAENLTLWGAIINIDPTFPRSAGSHTNQDAQGRWRRYPSPNLVRAAIKHATTPVKKSWLERLGLTRKQKYVYIERDGWSQKAIPLSD